MRQMSKVLTQVALLCIFYSVLGCITYFKVMMILTVLPRIFEKHTMQSGYIIGEGVFDLSDKI